MLCVVSSFIIVGIVCCNSLIIVGVLRCFFFNYCWRCVLFLLQLLSVLCVVSSSFSVGVVYSLFFN